MLGQIAVTDAQECHGKIGFTEHLDILIARQIRQGRIHSSHAELHIPRRDNGTAHLVRGLGIIGLFFVAQGAHLGEGQVDFGGSANVKQLIHPRLKARIAPIAFVPVQQVGQADLARQPNVKKWRFGQKLEANRHGISFRYPTLRIGGLPLRATPPIW